MTSHPDIPQALTQALGDRYRFERELGRGGMATVYLAQDLKHGRQVAIKVLRAELAAVLGAERFLAEVRVTAQLDHPHILTLIDSGVVEPDGPTPVASRLLYYILPYVRGESLRARLARERQLPVSEAVTLARQVAAALDHAHARGIIHRDVKPENILLHEGEAMLADFGIALGVSEAGGDRLTETGLALGTPQYMSPEQATGERHLDRRSDVYGLAAVTYEMLAGEPPLRGATPQATIAKLMTETPVHLKVVRPDVPGAVDDAVTRGLAKVPGDRFDSAKAFAEALDDGRTAGGQDGRTAGGQDGRTAGRQDGMRPHMLASSRLWGGVVLAALGSAAAWMFLRGQPQPTLRFGQSSQLTAEPGLEIQPAMSPDGKLVAYAAGTSVRMRIYIRPIGGGRTIPLSDDSMAVEFQPRWSPDGERLLFLSRGGVSIAPALGGSSQRVIPPSEVDEVRAATWAPDGQSIAFVRGDTLFAHSLAGQPLRVVGTGNVLHGCDWSPDAQWIVCAEQGQWSVPGTTFANVSPGGLVLFAAAGGELHRLVQPTSVVASPTWFRDSRSLLYLSSHEGPSDIYRLAIGPDGRARGAPARVTTGLGANAFSIDRAGRRLAYAEYTARANIWAIDIPARTPATLENPVPLTRGNQVIEAVRLSPDGKWLVYDSNLQGNFDVFRLPLAGGEPERLTSDPADEFAGDLSPDGTTLAYHTWRSGNRDIETRTLDGASPQLVVASPGQESAPRWSPDGSRLVYADQIQPVQLFVVTRTADGWSAPARLGRGTYNFSWSPRGNEVTTVLGTAATSPGNIVALAVDGSGPRVVVDSAALPELAEHVEWAPDGRTIYYKTHDQEGRAAFWRVGAGGGPPELVIRFTDPDRQSNRREFATDGRRFYFTMDDRQSDIFVAELEETR